MQSKKLRPNEKHIASSNKIYIDWFHCFHVFLFVTVGIPVFLIGIVGLYVVLFEMIFNVILTGGA